MIRPRLSSLSFSSICFVSTITGIYSLSRRPNNKIDFPFNSGLNITTPSFKMASPSFIESMKIEFPEFTLIDISNIAFTHLLDTIRSVKEKPKVLLICRRLSTNLLLWRLIDAADRVSPETKLLNEMCGYIDQVHIMLFHQKQSIGINTNIEVNFNHLRAWTEEDENCPICAEKVNSFGLPCHECGRAICSACFKKLVKQSMFKCPFCREVRPMEAGYYES